MCNCFLGNAENFIFDPKCKPSDTPDCDWHEIHVLNPDAEKEAPDFPIKVSS